MKIFRMVSCILAAQAALLSGVVVSQAADTPPIITSVMRVSLGAGGKELNAPSYEGLFSATGKEISFTSAATNAMPPNKGRQVFMRSLSSTGITLLSLNKDGRPPDERWGHSNEGFDPTGTYALFSTVSNETVAGDTNKSVDIFGRVLKSLTVKRLSLTSTGKQINGHSHHARFSGDGSVMVFNSTAVGLGLKNSEPFLAIYAKNLGSGLIKPVSVNAAGKACTLKSNAFSVNADGSKVVFECTSNSMSDTGDADSNGQTDVYLKDLKTGKLTLVSKTKAGKVGSGASYWPVFSPDGKIVYFVSNATNFGKGASRTTYGIYAKTLATGALNVIPLGDAGPYLSGGIANLAVSPNGRFLAFSSPAKTVVEDDTNGKADIFMKDLRTNTVTRMSVDVEGGQADDASTHPVFSPDSTRLIFQSLAKNLVPNDKNNVGDLFVVTFK